MLIAHSCTSSPSLRMYMHTDIHRLFKEPEGRITPYEVAHRNPSTVFMGENLPITHLFWMSREMSNSFKYIS